MKKIININLNGRVIPIEDSAYEQLQQYIESLRRYFANEEGRDEIINDIESRIAELLHEKIRKGATCITDIDIEEIAQSMGRPQDLEAAEEKAETTQQQATSNTSTSSSSSSYTDNNNSSSRRGRLYRDMNDKFIGGVCSGIAAYMNVDPAIIRIIFAIITFGGFGLGFLVYILLWIILPPKDLEGYHGKRLYRNPEDRILGGVAGGLAAYFDRNVSTIRLIFAAPIVLSILLSILDGVSWNHTFHFFPNLVFGSLSGTFILIYVVLWIVLPEAHSTYEKMEMRGERVDVNSIRQNVQDGMGNMKDRMKSWSDEVKESAQNLGSRAKEFANTRGKTFGTEIGETMSRSGRGLGHAIGVLFKVLFLFIAGSIAFALFVALIALIFGGVAWWPINDFLWTSKWQQGYAWGTLIFFLVVPVVGLIIWTIRRISRVRSRSSYLGWTFSFLWTIGWVSVILLVSSIVRDFDTLRSADHSIAVSQPRTSKMIVIVSQPELEYSGRFSWLADEWSGWDLSGDTMRMSTVKFTYPVKSPDSLYHVTIRKWSYGRTSDDAINRAEKIQYNVSSIDSVLDLGNGYAIDKGSKFRGQQVEIEIQVPVGKKIRFEQSVHDKLTYANFRIKRRYRNGRRVNVEVVDNNLFRSRPGVDYTMGVDGNLQDPAGKTVDYEGYRYREDRNTNPVDDTQEESPAERRKRLEDEIRKIDEQDGKPSTKQEGMSDEDEGYSSSSTPSPLNAFISWIE